MARAPTGSVVVREGKHGVVYAIRFRAGGRRQYQTTSCRTRAEAEVELENVIADVRRGIWQPPKTVPASVVVEEEPDFWTFASEWIAARELEGLAPRTITDLRWSLSNHLLPFFKDHKLSAISKIEIDRYKTVKVRERQGLEEARARGEKVGRGLSNNSINHVLSDLAQVLETAVEYELIPSNPASGKRRRLKSSRPLRPWVEPEALPALLDAAKTEDGRAGVGRVLLGILAGAGLRISEALALRWRNVDLATGTLHVLDSKTAAGVRQVDLTAALREELTVWKAETIYPGPDDPVVATSTGKKHNPSNLRRDVLRPAVAGANEQLAKDGIAAIGELGFHGLRRTYASLRACVGDDPAYTSSQIGHEDPRFTLRCYTQATRRRERLTGAHLRAYDRAVDWARMGTSEPDEAIPVPMEATKNPG